MDVKEGLTEMHDDEESRCCVIVKGGKRGLLSPFVRNAVVTYNFRKTWKPTEGGVIKGPLLIPMEVL